MCAKTKSMKTRLFELTGKMDVPSFRRGAVIWLSKNLMVRNADHPNFPEAKEIIGTLLQMGVQ